MAHAKRADSAPVVDGTLHLDYFTDHGSTNTAVFTVFAKGLATVYIVFPPDGVVKRSRIGILTGLTPLREKTLLRWILANIHKATATRTFEIANGRAVGSQ